MPAVRRHLAVGVEHHRVDDVGLGRDLVDVLLERVEVVEEERRVRDRRQVARERIAPALELLDDRHALAVVDHDDDRGHDEHAHQKRAQQELRPKRAHPHRRRSSQILRNGMYGSPSPFTSMLRT